MRDFSVPGSTVIAQRAAAPLRFASVKSTHKALHTSRLSFIGGVREERELSRPSEMYSQTLCRFKLICVRSRTLTSIDSLFMEALVVSVRMMKLILYLTAWPHRYPASLPILCCERLKTRNMSQMRHNIPHGIVSEFSGFSEHFWCDSIGNVTGIKAANVGRILWFLNDEFRQCCVSANFMIYTFADTNCTKANESLSIPLNIKL